jgi:hypothetical protein
MAMYFATLKVMMEARRVRAYELAQLVKVSPQLFSLKMHGRLPFSHIEKKRISEFFGLSEDTLFEAAYFRHMAWLGGTGPRPPELQPKVENATAKTPGLETR